MKRVHIIFTLLIISLLSFSSEIIFASNSSRVIPDDPAVRRGVLKNGLTYYVRENRLPKGQADFYILSDVGAIQEEDDQQGLAHFLEHMAFNGTKNMPGKEIINYLESIGVKFGANLNAATSWDYTIYMMKDLPTKRQNSIDSALLILRDWAGFIEPHKEEIDKERGVIKEELRTRDGANWRSTLSLIAALGKGTKYEHRNLIGTLEGLDSFEAKSLERFYHDWYTPDHQAIIVVGDIDAEVVESQIKKLFKALPPASRKAPKKEIISVERNETPLIDIYSDKEMMGSMVQYYIRREAMDRESSSQMQFAEKNVEEALITMMQNNRFREVVMSPDAPIMGGGMNLGRIGVIPTLEATTYGAQSEDGAIEEALQEVVTQMERTRRYGFNSEELEHVRRDLMSSIRSSYLNRNDRTNNSFIDLYVSNYRFGEPIPSAEQEWQIDSTLIATASIEAINRRVKSLFSDDNNVIAITSPEKEGLEIPTKETILKIVADVKSNDIAPYEQSHINNELLTNAEELPGSQVIAESKKSDLGATEWLLENGIKIVVRPSTLKNDEVILSGRSDGGLSLLSDSEYVSGDLLPAVLSSSGVGDYSAIELSKVLSGKNARLWFYTLDQHHGVGGECSPADIETLLQLLYLNFTSPRLNESDFEIYRRRLRSYYDNMDSNPDYQAQKRYGEVVYDGAVRNMPLTAEQIDSLDFESFSKVYNDLFSDGDNFRFTIAGNVDLEALKPLIERYIGSIQTDVSNPKLESQDLGIRAVKGVVEDNFEVKMEQPKVGVEMLYWGEEIEYSSTNIITASYLKAALDDLLLESVREELGGTYGVGTAITITNDPYQHYHLSLSYDTNEEQIRELQQTIYAQLEILATDGVSQSRMDKTREFLLKSFGNMKEQNRGWMKFIDAHYNDDFNYINDYEKIAQSITSDDVKSMAHKILNSGNRVEVIMHPQRQ